MQSDKGIRTTSAEINTLVSRHSKCMNIIKIIWKTFQSKPHQLDEETIEPSQELLHTRIFYKRYAAT